MKKVLLVILLLFSTNPLFAQLQGVATIAVSDDSGLGYTVPTFTGGLGLEYILPHLELGGYGHYSPNRKDSEDSGYSYGFSLEGHVHTGICLFGGGASYSKTIAPNWTKDAIRPFISFGLLIPVDDFKLRVILDHYWWGTDTSNRSDGERGSFGIEWKKNKINLFGGLHRFHASEQPDGTEYTRTTYGLSYSRLF